MVVRWSRLAEVALGLSSVGCYVGVGPKVGYSTKHGPTLGWELSTGAFPYAGIAAGQSYALRGGGNSGTFGLIAGAAVGETADLSGGAMVELGMTQGLDDGAVLALRTPAFWTPNRMDCEVNVGVLVGLRIGIAGSPIGGVFELVSQVGMLADVCFSGFGGGRPLRANDDEIVLPHVALLDRHCEGPRVADAWIDDARTEAASVTAFTRMAAELAVVGAPAGLAIAARAAARDELRHTLLCTQRSGRRVALLPLRDEHERPRWHRPSTPALSVLAREAWFDGCIAEAIGAARAASSAERFHDEMRDAYAEIARDERRHAELAWSVLEWAWREGPVAVRDTIAELVRADPRSEPRVTLEEDRELLAAHGRLDAEHASRIATRELARAIDRGRRLLAM